MQRRSLLKSIIGAAALPFIFSPGAAVGASPAAARLRERCRPGSAAWPSAADWESLQRGTQGRLLRPQSPFAACATPGSDSCREALANLKNPFYLGDEVALTQTSGWVGAWRSQPSAYALAAETAADVAAAVNFARMHSLRLVVKGGGHSYQGNSCSADSLLVWTRRMNSVALHEDFVASGCQGRAAPQPAVSVGAGAMWIDVYDAVTTGAGRYVQGGGCTSVGVAGLISGGGFGSFSKRYGSAAAGLLEAEIVTADGEVRIANACKNSDLFWAIKGGGGGTFGVITRLTLRTRELPETFGAVFGAIHASSDAAYRQLIERALSFYRSALFNPQWGEKLVFRTDNTLELSMLFCGMTKQQAQTAWTPFLDWVRANPAYTFAAEFKAAAGPARRFWDAKLLKSIGADFIVADARPAAPEHHFLWAGDQAQAGWTIRGYKSLWLPAELLEPARRAVLADAVYACTRHWEMQMHFNKGLAGAPDEEIEAARNTAMNPAVLNAFALAIIGADAPPSFAGMPDAQPDLKAAHAAAAQIEKAMDELLRVASSNGSYVSESDFFEADWQRSFWGKNYPELQRIKQKYDAEGLFFVHHGVGSESWNADGFVRVRPSSG
jgi:FAD/FMN-containing dehydrogenase